MDVTSGEKAPELISEKSQWLNSEPLALEKLKGKIVLLDFWAYSCVNCLRALPALKRIWEKYKGRNVVIIGVHTPEFEFEKNVGNVRAAVKRLGIGYPVLNDPERINWHRYGNMYWPRTELINSRGELAFEHIGESGYDEIDKKIMEELGIKGEAIIEEKREYQAGMSPEIYAGSLRSQGIGSAMVCTEKGCEYFDTGSHAENIIYLSGQWRQEPEYLEFEGEEGYISLKFYAGEANIVMEGSGIARVLLDEGPIAVASAGGDVVLTNGESCMNIDGADMYNIVKSDILIPGELKIVPFKGLRIYAFTFG